MDIVNKFLTELDYAEFLNSAFNYHLIIAKINKNPPILLRFAYGSLNSVFLSTTFQYLLLHSKNFI